MLIHLLLHKLFIIIIIIIVIIKYFNFNLIFIFVIIIIIMKATIQDIFIKFVLVNFKFKPNL